MKYQIFVAKVVTVTVLMVVLNSCKTIKKNTTNSIYSNMKANEIIEGHYAGQSQFKTLSGKLRIDYSNEDDAQGYTVSFRMQRDQKIWISAPFGLVKALITPDRVSFYNRLQGEYFDGDFSYLSKILGTEIDFIKLQNLLLGDAILNLKEQRFELDQKDGMLQLSPVEQLELYTLLLMLSKENLRISIMELAQPAKNNYLKIVYKNYQYVNQNIIPKTIAIDAINAGKENVIAIEYRNMVVNQNLNFPYKIPNGYKEITLSEEDQ